MKLLISGERRANLSVEADDLRRVRLPTTIDEYKLPPALVMPTRRHPRGIVAAFALGNTLKGVSYLVLVAVVVIAQDGRVTVYAYFTPPSGGILQA